MHRLGSRELSFDANCVIDFAKTANLALLDQLFNGRILLSDFVAEELARAGIEWKQARTVVLSESELQLFEDIRRNNPPLGIGEIGAITIARLRDADLITNDRQARSTASQLGIHSSGSLAVLVCAVELGAMTAENATQILSEMVLAGAWLSEDLIESFRSDVMKAKR